MSHSPVEPVKVGDETIAKGDGANQHVKPANGDQLEKQVSPLESEVFSRPDGASVDDIYERKVYILNKVMNEHIGMGKVQWQLFLLSGWGWMADNLWLQGVAIILPQVEREFNIQSDVRWMTFSLYCGLILGAATWGILADVIGRRPSFNITLCIAGIFGIAGGAAPSFVGLGGLLAALGFGLGGNLPVDGMMFLEFVPAKSQYLLTLLSVFWSLGQLLASLVAWAFIANYSCNGNQSNTVTGPNTVACDVSQNKGWRYSFYTFGALTFAMFIARYFVFNLPESPKYYLSRGRDADAVAVLKDIAARNGKPLGDDVISVEIFRSAAGQEASMDAQEIEHKPKGMKRITSAPKEFIHNFKGVSFTPDLSHVRPLFFGWRMAVTTSLLWVLWSLIGLAYPLYNAFLPIYLSGRCLVCNGVWRFSHERPLPFSLSSIGRRRAPPTPLRRPQSYLPPPAEAMGSSSSPSPPPPPMIGRAGNLTVFITPPSPASTPRGALRTPPPESPRSDFSTPTRQRIAPSPSPSPSPQKHESPFAAPAVVFTPPPPSAPVKVAPPPVQVPPPQYEKASAGGKHDGSAFGFFWDAVARVQEAHASLDEYMATWFGLDQSKYQWALNDYYEATGKDVDCVKGSKLKELTTKVQKV